MCIIISGLVFYFNLQSFEKNKLMQLTAYISLAEHIKNQVECYLLPIDKILMSADKGLLGACSMNGAGEYTSLKDLVDASCFYLDEESISTIKGFADEFGVAYRAEQLRSCEYCISELKKQKDSLREKNAKEKKVKLALCLCASLSIVLLLI